MVDEVVKEQQYNNEPLKKKWFDIECHDAQKWLLILDVIKDKENYQKHLHKHKRLIQRKRRIWEITQEFLQMQEKAHACAKIWEI